MAEPVVIVDYDSQWPLLYEREKTRILATTGHLISTVEHVGSTAIPGLGAKPIIDIIAGGERLTDAEQCIPLLQSIGYEYVHYSIAGIPERRYFDKDAQGRHTYHLHMVEITSDFWRRHILFRDYLRTHPEVAQAYYELKVALAIRFRDDRNAYTEAKTAFIRSIEAKASAAGTPSS